ncbi:MAG: esterase [Prevotella sp.]|nr:esterase [Prevotella sp.]
MMTENPYVKQFPGLMAGKTILYCHGFASSGQSGTVKRLREVMPQARVVAPDLPVHPHEAIALLHAVCEQEHPDLIIGTSMGGMYAEQLCGYDRICVNPALEIAETMRTHGMTGTQQFQNPRLDGQQEFYVDKALVKEYRDVSEQRFAGLRAVEGAPQTADGGGELERVWGLFGDEDTTVDTFGLFSEHYPQALHFHGEHRMNDQSFMHSVVPVIRWIDDRQDGRQRPIIYIGVETMMDAYRKPAASVQKAVRLLIEHYQVYFVAPPGQYADTAPWLEAYVNVPAWQHDVYTCRRDLLYGDYLISRQREGDTMATLLAYGSDTFKTWDDIIAYFSRLGGQ